MENKIGKKIINKDKVLIGTCSTCKYWQTQPAGYYSPDMGKCLKMSADVSQNNNSEYPDREITGIESTPICPHDGIGVLYETKGWFACIHHTKQDKKYQ